MGAHIHALSFLPFAQMLMIIHATDLLCYASFALRRRDVAAGKAARDKKEREREERERAKTRRTGKRGARHAEMNVGEERRDEERRESGR